MPKKMDIMIDKMYVLFITKIRSYKSSKIIHIHM